MVDRNFVLRLRNLAGNEVCRVAAPPAPGHEAPDEVEDRAAAKAWRYSVFTAVERATRACPHAQRYGDIITAEPLLLEELRTTADIRHALQLDAFAENGEGVAEDRFTIEGTGNDVLVEGVYVTVDAVAGEEERRRVHEGSERLGRRFGAAAILGIPPCWEFDSMEIMRTVILSAKDHSGTVEALMESPHAGYLFGFASERLRDSEELATLAVGLRGGAISSASERLRDSEELATLAVGKDGHAIQYVSERLRDSEELAALAVRENVSAIEHVSERLRDSEELAALAVRENVFAIEHVSERLRDSEELARLAVAQDGTAIEGVSERLRDSEELAALAVGRNGFAIKYVSERLRDSEELARLAVAQDGTAIEGASERLRDSEELAALAVGRNGFAIKYVSERLRDSEELAALAMSRHDPSDGWAPIRYVSARLRSLFASK